MSIITSIGLFIKSLSLPAKIIIAVTVGTVAIGGTTVAIVAVNNSNSNQENNVESSSTVISDNSGNSNENSAENKGASSESKTDAEKTSGDETNTNNQSDHDGSSNSSQIKPTNSSGSSSANSSNVSSSNANSSSSSNNSNNSTGSQSTPAAKPDYNLNDRYVAGQVEYAVNTKLENDKCVVTKEVSFFAVAKYKHGYADLWDATYPQYQKYIAENGFSQECGGLGFAYMSWEETVAQGLALDEAKCAQYGLSCGRW